MHVDHEPTSTGKLGGNYRRRTGSRQPAPLAYDQGTPSTWQELNAALKEGEPGLRAIRQLMKNPPRAMEWEITQHLDMDRIPNFIGTRLSAQCLATAAINDLHRGNLADALENLEALQGCVRLNSDEPALVNFMIRVAVAGLGSDTGWDALQETGWTEPQLLRLQQACQANDLLPQMPKALAAERLARLHSMDWLGATSYQEWVDRYTDILKSFGAKQEPLHRAGDNPSRGGGNPRGHRRKPPLRVAARLSAAMPVS